MAFNFIAKFRKRSHKEAQTVVMFMAEDSRQNPSGFHAKENEWESNIEKKRSPAFQLQNPPGLHGDAIVGTPVFPGR